MTNAQVVVTTPYTEILLVDDDEITLMVSERFILKSGISASIKKFLNGKEAFDYLVVLDHAEDCLVLLDINMPVMNGWAFLDAISKNDRLSSVDVVILSSSVSDADKQHAATFPQVKRYLEKPVSSAMFERLKDPQVLGRCISKVQALSTQ